MSDITEVYEEPSLPVGHDPLAGQLRHTLAQLPRSAGILVAIQQGDGLVELPVAEIRTVKRNGRIMLVLHVLPAATSGYDDDRR
jgi:hypothetical protein